MNFEARYPGKELLDQDDIPFGDIELNMKELNTINTYLGGHSITIEGFKALAAGRKFISVCEIGCGGGDNLAAIYSFAKKNGVQVRLTGIDLKESCISYARKRKSLPADTIFITSDYRAVAFNENPDIIFSSLFCHHFTNRELADQFAWMKQQSAVGFFVNDLQRNILAYYSIKIITSLFSSSYLVKHDAPVSVRRGFHRNELNMICREAKITPVKLLWRWAFRFLLMYKHG